MHSDWPVEQCTPRCASIIVAQDKGPQGQGGGSQVLDQQKAFSASKPILTIQPPQHNHRRPALQRAGPTAGQPYRQPYRQPYGGPALRRASATAGQRYGQPALPPDLWPALRRASPTARQPYRLPYHQPYCQPYHQPYRQPYGGAALRPSSPLWVTVRVRWCDGFHVPAGIGCEMYPVVDVHHVVCWPS